MSIKQKFNIFETMYNILVIFVEILAGFCYPEPDPAGHNIALNS